MHTELVSGAAVVFYVANWYRAAGHPVAAGMGHLWSLAVEEQFYLVWPTVTALAPRYPALTADGVLDPCPGSRRGLHLALHPVAPRRHAVRDPEPHRLPRRLDAARCARGAHLRTEEPPTDAVVDRRMAGARPARLLPVLSFRLAAFWYVGGFTLVAIASAVIILAIAEGEWQRHRVVQRRTDPNARHRLVRHLSLASSGVPRRRARDARKRAITAVRPRAHDHRRIHRRVLVPDRAPVPTYEGWNPAPRYRAEPGPERSAV